MPLGPSIYQSLACLADGLSEDVYGSRFAQMNNYTSLLIVRHTSALVEAILLCCLCIQYVNKMSLNSLNQITSTRLSLYQYITSMNNQLSFLTQNSKITQCTCFIHLNVHGTSLQ